MHKYYQQVSYVSLYKMFKIYKNSSTAFFTAYYYLFKVLSVFIRVRFFCFLKPEKNTEYFSWSIH